MTSTVDCVVLADNSSWVVLKFGGTSVSSPANWHNIAGVLRARIAASLRPVVVHSALSGITDRLEALLAAAPGDAHAPILSEIEATHRQLAGRLNLVPSPRFEEHLRELCGLAAGLAQSRVLTDALRARVMAMGELLSTTLGEGFLNAQGIATTWVDARQVLRAEDRGATHKASLLSATCDYAPDAALQARWRALDQVVITQGFIAANAHGETVLLGRGGSDTSGAYLAAKLAASRLEIWTDVPGLFSANPRAIPSARLLRALHYDEAQEIASNGAKVLHPRCVLPVRQYQIPLHVYATQAPDLAGTVVSAQVAGSAAQVKAIAIKKGITLVSMESPGMWHQVGFLADAFQVFKQQGLSVDLVSTSETNVTVSLDPAANTLDAAALERLSAALGGLCRVEILGPCASLSLLGQNIRGILHEMGAAFELFQDQKIYLVTQAANDLNFTFVIDESQGDRLVRQLHERLIENVAASDQVLGPTWSELFADKTTAAPPTPAWWADGAKRQALLAIAQRESAAYVYDMASLDAAIGAVLKVGAVKRWAYAMKANGHPAILQRVHAAGLTLECVSRGELEHAFASVPGLQADRVLFTPNFAPRVEYEAGFERGVHVTLDNLYPLKAWPRVFRGREIFVRVDPGFGRGHHTHVRTAGAHSKFGIPMSELDELMALARDGGVRITGLHAHTGSGIFDVANWTETGALLAGLAQRFPDVKVVDLGGGLGVPEQAGRRELDLGALGRGVAQLAQRFPQLEFWMEPGRFLVAGAGVLVALVTQLKGKGDVQYVGIATGMNSLIRPALYGAHHDIVNLTRISLPQTCRVNIVGPICESADLLGADRWLPPTEEGDVLLIANCGAYGQVMSSHYNRRAPAQEFIIAS